MVSASMLRRNSKTGFTTIEVLLVVSMVAMITLTLYTAFINGVKVWKRSQSFVREEKIVLFFDKISEELRNSFKISTIEIQGKKNSLAFPAIVRVPADPRSYMRGKGYIDQVGQVKYYFDSVKKGLYKRIANYGLAVEEKFFEPRVVVESVEYLEFRYKLFRDGKFVSATNIDEVPALVQVEIRFLDSQGLRRQMKKDILIPIGCGEDKDAF